MKFFAKSHMIALVLASSAAFAAPALADSFSFGGGFSGGGGFSAGANANTNANTWGNGTVLERWSWSDTETGTRGDLFFDGSISGGVDAGFSAESYGIAASGNHVKTNGSYTGAASSSSVSGGFFGGGGISGGGGFTVTP